MHDSEHEANGIERQLTEHRLTRALDLLAITFETDAVPVRSAVEQRALSQIEAVASEVCE